MPTLWYIVDVNMYNLESNIHVLNIAYPDRYFAWHHKKDEHLMNPKFTCMIHLFSVIACIYKCYIISSQSMLDNHASHLHLCMWMFHIFSMLTFHIWIMLWSGAKIVMNCSSSMWLNESDDKMLETCGKIVVDYLLDEIVSFHSQAQRRWKRVVC